MLAKLFQKHNNTQRPPLLQQQLPATDDKVGENVKKGGLRAEDINPRVNFHYGIPSTASLLAFDPIQSLLAVATLDGRIKVIGGNNIEGLLVSPKQLPFKHLEFLQNQGFLVSVSNENEIQVWDLEKREIASALRWDSSITAFSVICGSGYMYVGDEFGMVYVLKYDAEEAKLKNMPYYVPRDAISASGKSLPDNHSVVGVLPQYSSLGSRLLIAYVNGLIVLWDSSDDKVMLVRGNKDLKLKSNIEADSRKSIGHETGDDISDSEQEDKEISSLCWASVDESVLAVGYVDGDIMLWNLSTAASNDVVKLQLSPADRRLPVIVLRWSASHNDSGGRLFVYGGDAIGSEEVLTILSLDWSSGIESVKCKGRVDLTLAGSFADMVLLPGVSQQTGGILLLTSPGQLYFYDNVFLSSLISQQDKKNYVPSQQYPMVIPTTEPYMTIGKLGLINTDSKTSKTFIEKMCAARHQALKAQEITKWPLTGGIPGQPFDAESHEFVRLYLAGYQDGSVRIWDASYPTFSIIYVLGSEVIDIADATASVSALALCSVTLSVAVGNELGMIRLYKMIRSVDETSLVSITTGGKEVLNLPHVDGPQCAAVFSFIRSPVRFLQFVNFGTGLVVGFHSGQVAVLDVSTSTVHSVTDSILDPSSLVNCMAVKSISDTRFKTNNQEDTESKSMDHSKWAIFLLTSEAHIVVVDCNVRSIVCSLPVQIGKESTITSMFIIEDGDVTCTDFTESENAEAASEPAEAVKPGGSSTTEIENNTLDSYHLMQKVEKFHVVLCCEDALHLYSLRSLKKGNSDPIQKVDLLKWCCWATTFKKDDKECGIIVLYQTGELEIRSLMDLQVVGERSLMAILRWHLKPNMEKTICSAESGQIILMNGCEFASLSVLAHENDYRIPESMPVLHDKVLAAAVSSLPAKNKMEGATNSPSILGGLVKSLPHSKVVHSVDPIHLGENGLAHLESIFSNPPFLKPSLVPTDDNEVVELSIDEIDIDGPLIVSSSSEITKEEKKGKEPSERERLFDGGTSGSNPRPRTIEEIKAKYRKEDPTATASQARDKLLERQEKLERLSLRTQELQDGAQNFASMAAELAKQMEKKKWWNL